jgi:hypothetical protein
VFRRIPGVHTPVYMTPPLTRLENVGNSRIAMAVQHNRTSSCIVVD